MAGVDLGSLASSVGISPDQFRTGLGAVLNAAKEHLSTGDFGQVEEKVPEASAMMAAAAQAPATSGGGVLGSLAAAAGSLLGGKGASDLLGKLAALGLTPEQIAAFLPKAIEFLKAYLPADLLGKITGALKTDG